MLKFEVGGIVRIINENECYVDDPKMVSDHIRDPYNLACYCMSSQPCIDDIGKIVAGWEDNGQNIYYVRVFEGDDCNSLSRYCYLMDEAGLEAYEKGIKVGDTVEIIDPDLAYTTYTAWVTLHITDSKLLALWSYQVKPKNWNRCTVMAIGPHIDTTDRTLAFVQVPGKGNACYLMDIRGLKKDPRSATKSNTELAF